MKPYTVYILIKVFIGLITEKMGGNCVAVFFSSAHSLLSFSAKLYHTTKLVSEHLTLMKLNEVVRFVSNSGVVQCLLNLHMAMCTVNGQ